MSAFWRDSEHMERTGNRASVRVKQWPGFVWRTYGLELGHGTGSFLCASPDLLPTFLCLLCTQDTGFHKHLPGSFALGILMVWPMGEADRR